MSLLLFALATLGCQAHRLPPAASQQAPKRVVEHREPVIRAS
ncbi:MAG: hypothetical protein ACJATT_003595 [Myxococcota bacterium]|jgi:hypothetical protein